MSDKQIDDGGPAFPSAPIDGATDDRAHQRDGMSLRDWFAGRALAVLADCDFDAKASAVAEYAYKVADAMLAARKAGGK